MNGAQLKAQLKGIEREIKALEDSIEALIEEADRKKWSYADPVGIHVANLIAARRGRRARRAPQGGRSWMMPTKPTARMNASRRPHGRC